MTEPVLDWNKVVNTNVLTSDKHNAGSVIATVNDKITVGSEAEKRQYELPKTSIERFSGSEVFLKISYC
jgi:hypothetical protein